MKNFSKNDQHYTLKFSSTTENTSDMEILSAYQK